MHLWLSCAFRNINVECIHLLDLKLQDRPTHSSHPTKEATFRYFAMYVQDVKLSPYLTFTHLL